MENLDDENVLKIMEENKENMLIINSLGEETTQP